MLTIKRFIVLIALMLGTWLVLPVAAQNFVWGSINGIPFGPGVDLRGNLTFTPDNTYDIGVSGATRPNEIYTGADIHVGGVARSAGVISTGNINTGASNAIFWASRALMRSGADGVIVISNQAESDFSRLQFGGTTTAFPAQCRDGVLLVPCLGDGTARPTVTVDGATTFAIPSDYFILACTGAETINTITGATKAGARIYIEHSDTECTLADDESVTAANAIDLTGAANDVGAVNKVIELIYNGTHWLQLAESDN